MKEILVPQTHRWFGNGEEVWDNKLKVTIHSRYIDVGRIDISIIPSDDMP